MSFHSVPHNSESIVLFYLTSSDLVDHTRS